MGGGFVGTALTAMLAQDGFFPAPAEAAAAPRGPLTPRPTHAPGKAKA